MLLFIEYLLFAKNFVLQISLRGYCTSSNIKEPEAYIRDQFEVLGVVRGRTEIEPRTIWLHKLYTLVYVIRLYL